MAAVNLKKGYKFYNITVYFNAECESFTISCSECDLQSISEFCLQPQLTFLSRSLNITIQAKNQNEAYEKAAHIFSAYMTEIGDKVYRALDKLVVRNYYYRVIYNVIDNVWLANKIPVYHEAKDGVVLFNTIGGHVECYVYAPNENDAIKNAKNSFVNYIEKNS